MGPRIPTRYCSEIFILGKQINDIMDNLDIFPLILMSDIFSNKELTLILTIIIPSDVKHYNVTHEINNIRFEGRDIHYHSNHSSPYQTHRDTSDNVCLDLQNRLYSICIYLNKSKSYLLRDLLVDDTFPESNVNSDFWKYIRNRLKLHLNIACL